MTDQIPPAKPRKSGWTPERRRKQAESIRRWKPWAKSTGPRTTEGKSRARYNAWKHGLRGVHHRKVAHALTAQRHFLRMVARMIKKSGERTIGDGLPPFPKRSGDYAKNLLFRGSGGK